MFANPIARTSCAIALALALAVAMRAKPRDVHGRTFSVAFVQGYAFAWVGHFFFEHNKAATFKYPWFSLMGDWKLWWDILTGKVRI